MKKLIICIICLMFITGCFNYREIDTLANVSSIIIHHENNEFVLVIEVSKNFEGENRSYLINTSGLSFEAAINSANQNYNKVLYFANVDLILLTTNALNKLSEITRYINRDLHFSYNFNMAITHNASDLYEFAQDYDDIFGVFIRELVNNGLNNRYNVTYLNFLANFVNNNIIRLPVLNVRDNQITFNLVEVRYE